MCCLGVLIPATRARYLWKKKVHGVVSVSVSVFVDEKPPRQSAWRPEGGNFCESAMRWSMTGRPLCESAMRWSTSDGRRFWIRGNVSRWIGGDETLQSLSDGNYLVLMHHIGRWMMSLPPIIHLDFLDKVVVTKMTVRHLLRKKTCNSTIYSCKSYLFYRWKFFSISISKYT